MDKIKGIPLLWLIASPAVYLLSLLTPKDSDIWCFGAWFGEKYSDNSRYLFEYVSTQGGKKVAVWITKRHDVVEHVRSLGYQAEYYLSIKGLLFQLRAGTFFCSVNSRDFYFACLTRRARIIQLWHGLPWKRIGFDAKPIGLKDRVRSATTDSYSYVLCPSAMFEPFFMSAFGINADRILRLGYPRNEGFFAGLRRRDAIRVKLGIPAGRKLVVYMPTHRSEGREAVVVKSLIKDMLLQDAEGVLGDFHLLIKPHFYDLQLIKEEQGLSTQVVHDFGDIETYEVLGASDALITDYSSIAFDYEVLGRPIYFLTPDLEDYALKGRGLYFDFSRICRKVSRDVVDLFQDITAGRGHLIESTVINTDRSGVYSAKIYRELSE